MATAKRLSITMRPVPKERPRVGRGGHIYTPKTTATAEKLIREAWVEKYGDEPTVGPVGIHLIFDAEGIWVEVRERTQTSKLRGDLDNYVKTVMDALNGVAYKDDKQVVDIQAGKA